MIVDVVAVAVCGGAASRPTSVGMAAEGPASPCRLDAGGQMGGRVDGRTATYGQSCLRMIPEVRDLNL